MIDATFEKQYQSRRWMREVGTRTIAQAEHREPKEAAVDSSSHDRRSRLSSDLVGTWELVSRIDRNASGETKTEPTLGSDPVALLYYDRSGHFAAQFMKRDRTAATVTVGAAGPNNSRAIGGYDAYFGLYSVDDDAGTVTQRLLGALSAENVGQVLTREMKVVGDTLTISLDTATADGEPVTRTLAWKRVG